MGIGVRGQANVCAWLIGGSVDVGAGMEGDESAMSADASGTDFSRVQCGFGAAMSLIAQRPNGLSTTAAQKNLDFPGSSVLTTLMDISGRCSSPPSSSSFTRSRAYW